MRISSSWTMVRGRPGHGVVLAVTGDSTHVQTLAERIADGGYYAFCATPPVVGDIFAMSSCDVVLLLADLRPRDRARIAALHATHRRQSGALVHLMPARGELLGIIADQMRLVAR